VRRKRVQEQTQIIASAIGKPTAKAPAIAKVNSESKFASGYALSADMLLAPLGKMKKPPPGRCGDGVCPSSEVQFNGGPKWLTEY
jgi:hypothetical protein